MLMVTQPTHGGVAKWVWQVSEALQSRGFDVSVAHPPTDSGAFEQSLHVAGVKSHSVPMPREIRPLADLRAAQALTRLMRQERYEMIHAHSSKAGILARFAARSVGIPAIYTPHAWSFYSAKGLKSQVYQAIERIAGRWTDRLIGVSADEVEIADRLRLIESGQSQYIPNGVVLPDLRMRAAQEARERLGLMPEDLAVCTIARLAPQKGIDILLRAAAGLQDRWPRLKLVIVGDGPLLVELQQLATEIGVRHVCWTGWQSDVTPYLRASDLFVLPSLWEGLPYALLEAMAYGLPSVATAVGGNQEVLSLGGGQLCPAGDVPALMAAMTKYLVNPEARVADGARARAVVAEYYSFDQQIARVQEVYQSVKLRGRRHD